ncbi:MAG: caspase family protein [Bacteroidetes bacterium]|nr:caspase family protein [Bacteroidota bacterium]
MKAIKFLVICTFLLPALVLPFKSMSAGDPEIQNISLIYSEGQLIITYEIANAGSFETFFVTAEIYKDPGNKITPVTLSGDVNTIVPGGTTHKIIWNVAKDGMILDDDIMVKIMAQSMQRINAVKCLGLSAIYPGAGDYQLPKHKGTWVKGFFTYGFLGGGIYFNQLSSTTYNQYKNSYNQDEIKKLYDKSTLQQYISYGLLGSAALIWTIDKIVLASKIHKENSKAKQINDKYYFNRNKESLVTSSSVFHINNKSPFQIAFELGDSYKRYNKYAEAKKAYLSALKINPYSTVVKDRISEINETLAHEEPIRRDPPNLFTEIQFEDDTHDGIIEARESARLKLKITNKGSGTAYRLNVLLSDTVKDPAFYLGSETIPLIDPDETAEIKIPIRADVDVRTAAHHIKISGREYFRYNMDSAYVDVTTLAYRKPELVFSGLEIIDSGDDVSAIIKDGKVQPGEKVKVRVTVQNTGQGEALGTMYSVTSKDPNIYIDNNSGNLETIDPGKIKTFEFYLSPNKLVNSAEKLPVFLTLHEDVGRGSLTDFQLPVFLNQVPPEINTLTVTPDFTEVKKASIITPSNKITASTQNLIDIRNVVPSKTKRPNSIGIVIGVEKYSELAPAHYASNDGKLMKEYFQKSLGIEKVYYYSDKDVTGFFFDNKFDADGGELQKAVIKGVSEVFVYYSGHGLPDKSGENVYLFPADGRISRLKMQGYNLETLYENLNNLGAKSVTIILDACFTGVSKATETFISENLTGGKGILIKPKKPWLGNPDFTIITSSSGAETSLGYDVAECGLFTYFLAAGLQGYADSNGDKKITLGELKQYIISNVTQTSTKIRGLQTPEFYGDESRVLIEF